MRLFVVVSAAAMALSACATPADISRTEPVHVLTFDQPPEMAVACVVEVAEDAVNYVTTYWWVEVRQFPNRDSIKVIGQDRNTAIWVVDLKPEGDGTRTEVRSSDSVPFGSFSADAVYEAIKTCA